MADEILETHERKLRRIAVEYTALGVALVTLAIVFLAPDRAVGQAGANPTDAAREGAYRDVYATLPTYPRPFTPDELRETHVQLALASAHLQTVRSATARDLARLRALERRG